MADAQSISPDAPRDPSAPGEPQRTLPRGKPRSPGVRKLRESGILMGLIGCGLFSIITTLGIMFTLGVDGYRFFGGEAGKFEGVSFVEFITGLQWSPLLGGVKRFGIWPLVCGTLMVTLVAMLVAGPLGIITAVWLSEYAPRRLRNILKPVLEVIAGVPTVVLGFFALTVITPALRMAFIRVPTMGADGKPLMGSNGIPVTEPLNLLNIDVYNVLSAGIAVGILTLPIVTSLSEDAIRAVPRALREGSFGLGATRFETSVKVVLPAALSGIIASFLLAIARCVGETMIVALAAGGSVVPLHHMTNPPMVMQIWHEAGTRDGSQSLATATASQPWVSPQVNAGSEEKIDELEFVLRPGSTNATAVRFELVNQRDGKPVLSETKPVPPAPAAGAPIFFNWEMPLTEMVRSAKPHDEARRYGVKLAAGRYEVRATPVDGTIDIAYANLDGERFLGIAERAAIPFDVRKSMQPMTGYLVQIFLGDVSNLGVEYYSSYAVAGVLFVITLMLTVIGHIIRVRFQQLYD